MSKEATFSLRYTHSTPDQIEADELIRFLSALNRIVVRVNRTFYGSAAVTSFRLTHVKSGSIDIQGFVELLRFRYGRMSLTATLLDDEYRQKAHTGEESFRHGDLLKVRLKTVQEKVGGKVVTRHFIVKVLDRIVQDVTA